MLTSSISTPQISITISVSVKTSKIQLILQEEEKIKRAMITWLEPENHEGKRERERAQTSPGKTGKIRNGTRRVIAVLEPIN